MITLTSIPVVQHSNIHQLDNLDTHYFFIDLHILHCSSVTLRVQHFETSRAIPLTILKSFA